MLIEYYFEIQYTKGTDNAQVDALSRKAIRGFIAKGLRRIN